MTHDRVRAGVPTGGQFAPSAHAEADIELTGTDAFPRDGDERVGSSRPTVAADGAIRDGRYDGMTRDQAWHDYRSRHPETLAAWGEQNDRWPTDDIIGYTNADPATLSVDPDPEFFAPVDEPEQDWCGVCGRPTDHFAEHDGLVEAGLAEYRNGSVQRTDKWDDALAREVAER